MSDFKTKLTEFDIKFRNKIINSLEINNSQIFHCDRNIIFILEKFFESAKYSINIFVKSLNDINFRDFDYILRNSHHNLPKEGIKLIEIVNQIPKKVVDYYYDNFLSFNDNVIAYQPIKYKNNPNNLMTFIIIDNKRYIIKYPTEPSIFNVCCYDPDKCAERNEFFNAVWNIEK